MHAVVPVICIVWYAKYNGRQEKMNKTDISNFITISVVFMILYYLFCLTATYYGVKEPYPIININPDDIDKWPLWAQVGGSIGFFALYFVINVPVLQRLKKRGIYK